MRLLTIDGMSKTLYGRKATTHSCSSHHSEYWLDRYQRCHLVGFGVVTLTHQRRQCDQPRPNVRERFDDLVLLDLLIFRAALIISNPLKRSNTLLLRQDTGVDRGIGQPDHDAYPDYDGEATEQDVDDLVWCKEVAIVERNPVRDEATKYLSETWKW